MRFSTALLVVILITPVAPAQAADRQTQPAKIIPQYAGGYKDDYPQELDRVRSYVLTAQSDIAPLIGLQYGQGFFHPVIIRFDDGAPAVNENPYFVVQTKGSGDSFSQEMIANVEAFSKHRGDDSGLRSGFRYGMTQLMLNDLAAGDSEKAMPLWVQEGLSVFVDGRGEDFIAKTAARTRQTNARALVDDLNSPGPYLTARAWANYYLGIDYIEDAGALPTFVRLMAGGTSAADAVQRALGQEWPVFAANVREYSAKRFLEHCAPDDEHSK